MSFVFDDAAQLNGLAVGLHFQSRVARRQQGSRDAVLKNTRQLPESAVMRSQQPKDRSDPRASRAD
jgi:hypothetical protein